jgi:EAL domain-containing protein (putative c-di-GMP-specific phosphodiesterase class I)
MGLGEDDSSDAIVHAIISLASSLELRVVAEGVELHSQLARLEHLGCDAFQGFLCSPARPAADVHFGLATLEEVVQ